MAKINRIIIHCSDSEFGDAFLIDKWHKENGWKRIAYNDVVLNAYPTSEWVKQQLPQYHYVGSVHPGRTIDANDSLDGEEIGAHAKGFNANSYGICMIGKATFPNKQLNATLDLIHYRLKQFNLTSDSVFGHCELDPQKTCPNIDMNVFRHKLQNNSYYGQVEQTAGEVKQPSLLPAALNFLKSFLTRK